MLLNPWCSVSVVIIDPALSRDMRAAGGMISGCAAVCQDTDGRCTLLVLWPRALNVDITSYRCSENCKCRQQLSVYKAPSNGYLNSMVHLAVVFPASTAECC